MASEGKDAEADAMDTSEAQLPDLEMGDKDQHYIGIIENVGTKTEPDLDTQMDSPEDAPPSSPCAIIEEGLLDSSASSRASSDRGTPYKSRIRTPSGGGIGVGAGMADNMSTCSTGSSSSQTPIQGPMQGKCPIRPGIIWRKGEKVEAMDFMKKWYSAKIVDIDEEEATVLIHFEGWNQRYDEWVEMTSDKLRPKMRHSGRKEKKKRLSGEYKLGEHVYARWTDCKMYPGKVTNTQSDGSYEVVFYDGFKKSVQPINIRPRPMDARQKAEIVNVLPKELRRKSNEEEGMGILPGSTMLSEEAEAEPGMMEPQSHQKEGTKLKQRKRPSAEGVTKKSAEGVTKNSAEGVTKNSAVGVTKKRRETTEGPPRQRIKEAGIVRKRSASATTSKKKLIVAGSFFARRERTDSDSVSVKSSSATGGADSPPIEEASDRTQLKVDDKPPIPPVGKPVTSIVEVPGPAPESVSIPSSPAGTVSAIHSLPATPKQPLPHRPDPTPGVSSDVAPTLITKREKKAKKRTASPSMSETSSTSESQPEVVEGTPARKRSRSKEKVAPVPVSQLSSSVSPVPLVLPQGTAHVVTGVPKKAFIIEQDHNHFKCVFEGCNKAFRKENLLDSHIKYYHCDDTKKHALPQPARKRRKTTSICSTDSDVSCSSKQTPPVLISKAPPQVPVDIVILPPTPDVQECVTVDIVEEDMDIKVADLKHQRTCSQDTMATEESIETEDELSKDEVVNCICLFNEENGLMIQCDVCMCWQHAVCFDLTVETLPKKYICFVCSDPTGVRESCRYIHEQEWIKHGNLTKFGFLNYQERDSRRAGTVQATCGLVSDIHNIKTVLHSLKEEIKLSRDHSHPQFKMWVTDLDSEELCPEDTGHGSFNQSNLMTDSDINQSDTVLHSEMDQSQTALHTGPHHSSLMHNNPSEQSCSSGDGHLVIKSEPVDITEISSESAETFQQRESDNTPSDLISVTDKDTRVVSDKTSLTEDTAIQPTVSESTASQSTASQSTASQLTASQFVVSQSTASESTSQSTASQSTASQFTVSQPTVSESTASQSTATQSTASPSTVSLSTEIQSTASLSTASQSTASQPTESLSTASLSTASQSTGSTGNQSTSSQSTVSQSTVSQSTETEESDRNMEAAGQTVKIEVKEEVVDECPVEEDPFQQCEKNLLQHILRVQGQVDSRLDMIEEQVIALEAAEMGNSCTPIQNPLTDLPTLRKSLHMLQSDLVKVKRMSAYHR